MGPARQSQAIVVLGGAPPDRRVIGHLPHGAVVVAADGGLDHARALGLDVDLVVGDLDSVSPDGLAWARGSSVAIDRHPQAKDQTDAELALDASVAMGSTRVVVLGGGDRLDHDLATLLLLARIGERVEIEAWWGPTYLRVLHGPTRFGFEGRAGELLSLVAVLGRAERVSTEGLRFELVDEALDVGSTRGISNEVLGGPAAVEVVAGTVLLIRPQLLGGPE